MLTSLLSFPTWGPEISATLRRVMVYSGLFSACPHFSAQDGGIGGEGEERPSESCLSPEGGRTNQQS